MYLWTESQSGCFEVSGPIPLLKLGHLKQAAQAHVQKAFEHLQGWRRHSLSEQWFLVTLIKKKSNSWLMDRTLCASGFAHYHPVTGNHWSELCFIFFPISFQIVVHVDEIHLSILFSRLSCQSFPHSRDGPVP